MIKAFVGIVFNKILPQYLHHLVWKCTQRNLNWTFRAIKPLYFVTKMCHLQFSRICATNLQIIWPSRVFPVGKRSQGNMKTYFEDPDAIVGFWVSTQHRGAIIKLLSFHTNMFVGTKSPRNIGITDYMKSKTSFRRWKTTPLSLMMFW